jgi:hypothetical protein
MLRRLLKSFANRLAPREIHVREEGEDVDQDFRRGREELKHGVVE